MEEQKEESKQELGTNAPEPPSDDAAVDHQSDIENQNAKGTVEDQSNDNPSATNTSSALMEQSNAVCHFCFVILLPFRLFLSVLFFALGCCANVCCDCTCSKFRKWKDLQSELENFLKDSGIKKEMKLNHRFVANVRMINAVQAKLGRASACQTEQQESPPSLEFLTKAARLMKYATAAYGRGMITSAELETGSRVPVVHARTRGAVIRHIGLSPSSSRSRDETDIIVVMKVDIGEDVKCLRHFCVVDHSNKAVVLAIRGTYSVSDIFVDLSGYCEDFCNGKAHSGMAKMARAVWEDSGSTILDRLNQLPDEYEVSS